MSNSFSSNSFVPLILQPVRLGGFTKNSAQVHLENINILLDTYVQFLTKFINTKSLIWKEETHIEYKNYRNLVSILMKKSKQAYYNKYFE